MYRGLRDEVPGISCDLVKTQYGFHIIKLVDKRGGTSKTIDEVPPH